jgi:hypothetical protein
MIHLLMRSPWGGIQERYEYDSGHTDHQVVVPTDAVEPFCREACGLSLDSCGGPCAVTAPQDEVLCVLGCYSPHTCDDRCDAVCEDACVDLVEGTECVSNCENLCARGCNWRPENCTPTPNLSQEFIDCAQQLKDRPQLPNECFEIHGHSQNTHMINYFGCLRSNAWECASPKLQFENYAEQSCYNQGRLTSA